MAQLNNDLQRLDMDGGQLCYSGGSLLLDVVIWRATTFAVPVTFFNPVLEIILCCCVLHLNCWSSCQNVQAEKIRRRRSFFRN